MASATVLIDGDWLRYATRRLKRQVDYARLLAFFQDHFGPKTPVLHYGTVDPQNRDQVRFMDSLRSLGYSVHTAKLRRRKDRAFTKGLDVSLAVQAMSLPSECSTLVLVSGDSDFAPVLEQTRRNGRSTIVITIPFVARSLVQASDEYIALERFLDSVAEGKPLSGAKRRERTVTAPKNWVIDKGDHLKPYLTFRKLFRAAKRELTLEDPYVDDQILRMVQLLPQRVSIRILTSNTSPSDFCVQVKKLRKEGYRIKVHKTNAFHDRFLGVDGRWWHSGHSFKDLGSKMSLISEITDKTTVRKVSKRIEHELAKTKELCV